jgi:hypothetical protein
MIENRERTEAERFQKRKQSLSGKVQMESFLDAQMVREEKIAKSAVDGVRVMYGVYA